MVGFVELPCLTGPALVRLNRVMLVRPDPSGAARTLLVMEGGHEVVVPRPSEEVVRLLES